MKILMEYFGTNLTEHGHYRWIFEKDSMTRVNYRFEQLPFHPEYLINNLSNGEVIFYQGGGYTVLGISGSCVDKRPGSKSIFFIKEILNKNEMLEKIKKEPMAIKILEKMTFKINLNL